MVGRSRLRDMRTCWRMKPAISVARCMRTLCKATGRTCRFFKTRSTRRRPIWRKPKSLLRRASSRIQKPQEPAALGWLFAAIAKISWGQLRYNSSSMAASQQRNIPAPNEVIFRRLLLGWFAQSQRKLPWRGATDPYHVLVSEIMLQQTAWLWCKERYTKFMAQFPSAERLANAREATVLAAWSGLGYYRRARALHGAAKEIVRRRSFPRSVPELMELPGVGRYTAAAVASIAFSEPVAVVDGNVKRVIDRLVNQKSQPQRPKRRITTGRLPAGSWTDRVPATLIRQ